MSPVPETNPVPVTSPVPEFTVTVDQNPYLAVGTDLVHAVIEIEAGGTQARPADAAPPAAAETIIIDISGSMSGEKLVAAKNAARVALDALRDGTYFAVIVGDHEAQVAYPGSRRLVQITPETRAEAKEALRAVTARGGTSFAPWLLLADELLAQHQDAIRHAILLTDGHGVIGNALEVCKGHFTCDARGIGGDWNRRELAKIASALLGTWDVIREPKDMEADFRSMIAGSMSKALADVYLRVHLTRGATLRYLRQVHPAVEDLTDKAAAADDGRGTDFPLGAWGSELREYEIGVSVDQGTMGMESNNPVPARAAMVSVVTRQPTGAGAAGSQADTLAKASVRVGWTDDLRQSTWIPPRVAAYTGQVELSQSMEAGLSALESRDDATAVLHLADARRRADKLGRADVLTLLDRIVEVVDEGDGTVRIRPGVKNVDIIDASATATRTVTVKKDEKGQ